MTTEPQIEVGIVRAAELEFNLAGKYGLSKEQSVYGQCSAKLIGAQIQLSNEHGISLLAPEIVLFPSSLTADSFELQDVVIGIDFHWEQKETQRFQGTLKIVIEDGQLRAINVLPVERYLISVISSEMRGDSSPALLRAHAVISRSWLLAQIEKQEGLAEAGEKYQSTFESETEYIRWWDREDHTLFHVCADDHCQRYQGITRAQNPNVVEAVNATAGLVLTYDGKIADARFSKSCGGASELFENCWEPVHYNYLEMVIDNPEAPKGYALDLRNEANADAWLRNSPDAFCNTKDPVILSQVLNDYDQSASDFYRWTVRYSAEELSELIHRRSGRDFGQIYSLVPIERGPSGRLIRMRIEGSKLTLTVGKELVIRRWLSESHLYSSAFVIDTEGTDANGHPTHFVLHGGGWGHGVGLCQIGAAVMGHKGYSYEEILAHYFKNTTLEKRY